MRYRQHSRRLRHVASIPFIWMMLVPTAVLHVFLEIYHRICFPLYGLPLVDRKRFFHLDRWKLPYLTWYERMNCWYCEYANAVYWYAVAIGSDTEAYWCGIRHARRAGYQEPEHHKAFVPYGDREALEREYCELHEPRKRSKTATNARSKT